MIRMVIAVWDDTGTHQVAAEQRRQWRLRWQRMTASPQRSRCSYQPERMEVTKLSTRDDASHLTPTIIALQCMAWQT